MSLEGRGEISLELYWWTTCIDLAGLKSKIDVLLAAFKVTRRVSSQTFIKFLCYLLLIAINCIWRGELQNSFWPFYMFLI